MSKCLKIHHNVSFFLPITGYKTTKNKEACSINVISIVKLSRPLLGIIYLICKFFIFAEMNDECSLYEKILVADDEDRVSHHRLTRPKRAMTQNA